MTTDDQVMIARAEGGIQTMENPGLKRHSSDETVAPVIRVYVPQYIKVTYRRTAASPTTVAPRTQGIGGGVVPPEPATIQENVQTPPPMAGTPTAQPVSATNGADPILRLPEANDAANQRRITQQQQVGGGQKENPAWTRAHQDIQEKVQQRRAHPLHQAKELTYDFQDNLSSAHLAAQVPSDDPVYPYNPQEHPEHDTVDLDNLQDQDDTYRSEPPDPRKSPLLDRLNDVLDEANEGGEEEQRGADANASALNLIMGQPEGTSLEDHKKAIDEYVDNVVSSHKETVKALHADWVARGGHKTGEPRPVYKFSPRYTKPQKIVPNPGSMFPEPEGVINYVGNCEGCGKRLWHEEGGSGDPRGAIGDHTAGSMDPEGYDMHGKPLNICPECDNDYERYKKVQDKGTGHKAGDPTGGFHWQWQRQPDGSQKNVRIDHTHSKDKKGKWHHPGEKPGTCPECGPGEELRSESAYSAVQDRVSAGVRQRAAHPLHQGHREAAYDDQRRQFLYNIESDDPDYHTKDMPPSAYGHGDQPMFQVKEPVDDEGRLRLEEPHEHPSWQGCENCLHMNEQGDLYGPDDALHQPYSGDYEHEYKPIEDLPAGARLARVAALSAVAHNDFTQGMSDLLDAQGTDGNWDWSPYMHGLYNGMALGAAIHDGPDTEPDYRDAPKHWREEAYEKNKNKHFEPVKASALVQHQATDESDEDFWARQPDVINGNHNHDLRFGLGDAYSEEHLDSEDGDEDPDLNEVIPDNMSLRDHMRLVNSGTVQWDGTSSYPRYTHHLNRRIKDSDGNHAFADEGHVIEHNTNNRGPVLPTEDNPDPHVLQYPWSHSYYPAGQSDDEGLTRGYNTADQALHGAQQLSLWGARHPLSQELLKGYRYIGSEQPYDPAQELPHEAAMRREAAYDEERQQFLYNVQSDDPDYYMVDKPPSAWESSAQSFMKLKEEPYGGDHEIAPVEDDNGYLTGSRLSLDVGHYNHHNYEGCQGCVNRNLDSRHPDDELHDVNRRSEFDQSHKYDPVPDLAPGVRL